MSTPRRGAGSASPDHPAAAHAPEDVTARATDAALRERVKELTALYETARLLETPELDLRTLLERLAALLPGAFQFPERTAAAVRLGELVATAGAFRPDAPAITSTFTSAEGQPGSIAVVLTAPAPDSAEPFLVEEQRLIDTIASQFAQAIDRRQATRALLRSEERMQTVLTAAEAGTWEWDLRTGRVTWSEQLERLAGLEPGTFGGTLEHFRALTHPDDQPVVQASIRRAQTDPEAEGHFDSELRLRQPDGTYRWIMSRGRVFFDANRTPVRMLGLAHDISRLRQLQRQFEQAQKMEALGRLSGSIAHDFNNLLTAIKGYAEFVADGLPDRDALRDDVVEIVAAADRATALTRQLLAFSRSAVLDRRAVAPGEVVRGMAKLLQRLIGPQIELAVEIGDDPGFVRIDPGQLEQVIMNLCVNARDAMPDGGRLTLQTRVIDFEDGVRFGNLALAAGRYALFSVSDTGIGMSAEVRERIFEAFFTTKEAGRGTGLGLATVHGIVEQAGGGVFVYSEPGRGSTFKVYLPWLADADEPRTGASRAGAALTGTETVVLVDDDDAVRHLAERALRSAGYTVHAFGDPAQGLAFLERSTPDWHLLVTDVVMPKVQGPELAAAARSRNPDCRVLYITGFTDRAIEPERDPRLLQKPFAPSGLLRAVRELLDP